MRALLGGKELDLPTDQVPAFTFAVEDSEDIGLVRGDESSQVAIPATAANRTAAGGYAMSEIAPRVLPFQIATGTASLFDGTAFIRRRSDREINFYAVGSNANWMAALGDKRLRSLDMGATETVDRAYVVNTWDDTTTSLYFPVVDFGSFRFRAAGYDVPFDKLRPGIRVAPFLQKAFGDAGYTLATLGRFNTLFPKLVLLNTNEEIPISDGYLEDKGATFSKATSQTVSAFGYPFIELTFPTVVSDPSTTYTAPGRYAAPLILDSEPTLTINLQGTFLAATGWVSITVQVYDFTASVVHSEKTYTITTTNTSVTDSYAFPSLTMAAGNEYGIRIQCVHVGTGTVVTNVNTASISWLTKAVPFQSGVSLDIAKQAPDMKVAELVKWLCNLYDLIPQTNGNNVTLTHYDDFYRPASEGYTDLTGRVTGVTTKVTDGLPSAYVFKHKEDDRDQIITALKVTGGPYAGGDYRFDAGGEGKEKEVEIGLAATGMITVFDTLRVPALRDIEGEAVGGFYPDRYGWEPRLCIADGLETGAWTYAGAGETSYPNCYSYGGSIGGTYSTLFGSIQGSVGVVTREWLTRLGRRIKPMMECEVIWRDHELMRFNPSKPVLAHDGQTERFYYPMEVEQHRFGSGRPSKTTLIPL